MLPASVSMATTSAPRSSTDARDLELLNQLKRAHTELATQMARRIVGQQDIIENLTASILAGGHVILIGVPGLAKTLMIQTLAAALDLKFSRIQFTPDLMPSDITGSELLEEDHGTGRRQFKFIKGPVFANIILADEINRAPPKTQAALLEEQRAQIEAARGEAQKLIAEGRATGDGMRATMLEETRKQQQDLLDRARRDIEAEKSKAIAELRMEAVDLAIAAAGKAIEKNLDDAQNRKLVESYLTTMKR